MRLWNSTSSSTERGMNNKFVSIRFNKDGLKQFKSSYRYGEYHSNWNWLMRVIEKINSLHYNKSNNRFKPELDWFLENNIEIIYLQVVKFIQWYNKQKK